MVMDYRINVPQLIPDGKVEFLLFSTLTTVPGSAPYWSLHTCDE